MLASCPQAVKPNGRTLYVAFSTNIDGLHKTVLPQNVGWTQKNLGTTIYSQPVIKYILHIHDPSNKELISMFLKKRELNLGADDNVKQVANLTTNRNGPLTQRVDKGLS